MKIKVNDIEKQYILKYLEEKINIKKYENELLSNYPSLIKPNDDGSLMKIINDYYVDQTEYELFKQEINDYIEKNYKKLLLISENLNIKYQYALYPHDTSKESFVKNGSLVLKVNIVKDHNSLSELKKLRSYLNTIENNISNDINVPVKILLYNVYNK